MTAQVLSFNPLDKGNLGQSVADALERAPLFGLGDVGGFVGVGIYAIYYRGPNAAYRLLVTKHEITPNGVPIYVGKAVGAGSRKGLLGAGTTSKALSKRLAEHAQSIRDVSNLELADFDCRYLVVDEIWIPLGEALMINRNTPIWNSLVEGFGNHDPGRGRHAGARPRWDTLHPGRAWAERCQPRSETAAAIQAEVRQFLHVRR